MAAALSVFACNSVPIGELKGSFSIKIKASKENTDPVKVDFLWVIDNSSSMCQEQAQLANSFDEFLEKIQSFVNIDFRIAVVTTDMLADGHKGMFRFHKAGEFPFACAERKVVECVEYLNQDDGTCSSAFGDGWFCDVLGGQFGDTTVIQNCNGSLNSRCHRRCDYDWECEQEFSVMTLESCKACEVSLTACLEAECGDGDVACRSNAAKGPCKAAMSEADNCRKASCTYQCAKPTKTYKGSGCIMRSESSACPKSEDLYRLMVQETGGTTPYLVESNAQTLFKCVGVVGAEQTLTSNLEQGLNAAIFALDRRPGLPNAEQARAFLRDDAYLVIVFVSDEDDCSTDDAGELGTLKKLKDEKVGQCVCEKDTEQDPVYGTLRPVSDAVNRIKAIKADPARILVAAIVGDSTKPQDEVSEDREAYTKSKCSQCDVRSQEHNLLFNTYICDSSNGTADYGRRYIEFVERFGKNGIVTNICAEEGIGPALDNIADRIIRVVTKICLTKPIKDFETLEVFKLGPKGECANGTDCGLPGGDYPQCSDGSSCRLEQEKLPLNVGQAACSGENAECYTVQISSDCPAEAGSRAVFFDFLLEPATSVSIEYVGCDPSITTCEPIQ